MATNDATIIATRLTSDELEKSINELVSKVDRAMGAMAKSVDNAIGSMKGSFGQLAKNTRDSATAAKELAMGYDSVADSLTKAMSKGIGTFGGFGTKQVLESEKQALLDFNKTYHESVEKARSEQDRLNKIAEIGRLSAQQSMRPRERWDVRQDSEINRLRMTIHGLELDLKRLDEINLSRQDAEWMRIQKQINEATRKIIEYEQQQQKLRQQPTANQFEQNAITQQFDLLTQKIKGTRAQIEQLAKERRATFEKDFVGAERDSLTQKLQAAKNEVKQLGQALIDADNEEKKLTQGSKQYTAEIQRRAQAIRESTEWQEKGRVEIQSSANAARTYIISAKSRLSIEERLLEIQKQETAELERQRTGGIRTTGSGSGEIGIKATREEIEKLIQAQRAADPVAAAMVERAYQVEASMDRGATAIGRNRQETRMTFGDYENLRAAIAAVLNVEQHRVQLVDQGIASYNKLNESLKQMTQAYQKLGSSGRSSDMGKNLASEIQKTQRAINEIQKQMTRPVSLEHALGLDENTLDRISYKLQQLNAYKRGINIVNPNKQEVDELKQVDTAIQRLVQRQNELMGNNARLSASNNALARSFNYMKNRLAFYFTVGASTQFVKQLIDIRGQYELLERSIGILIDSAQQGSKIFAELNAMAIKSPFTTMELGAAAKQLVAYDVAAKDVVDTTRRLADMAAAVGIPIERLTYALGQIKAYGYLNARDARMFANAGIPLVKELADYYTQLEGQLISTSDIYDRIKKKAIDYNDVMSVVNKMTDEGGKFFNFQEKAADTLKVRIANLTLAWNNMLNEIGKDNQGILAEALTVTKGIFENWRNISNTLTSIAVTFGLIKTFQLYYLLWAKQATTKTGVLAVLQQTFGKKLGENIMNIGMSFTKFLGNPAALAAAAVAGLSIALGKAIMDYRDLQQANENFNKSIADNANENIESIKKFFSEYKTQLETISGAAPSDQQKMWERLQDEIEKTTHNAEQFISALNQIEEIPKRIKLGEAVLEQAKEIGEEIKRLAEQEWFSVGGGFANAPLADNLIEVSKISNGLIKQFGDLKTAEETLGKVIQNSGYTNQWQDYNIAVAEAKNELVNFVSILDKANLAKIMGDDPNTQLANIREFATTIRDSFLATEKGQKITAEGQALLNKYLDEWIAKQGLANGIIKQRQIGSKEFTAAEIANIEASRTAWEDFFNQLNKSDKERLDYLIETNQTGSDEFRELWDKATKDMAENATTSYNLIQEQIANLRMTPDIVINVVYRPTTEIETDKQRQAFTDKYLKPQGGGVKTAKEYFAEREENVRKFGRFIKKEGEDNVEWEKRLGETYSDNTKKIKSLNNQLKNSANLSKIDKNAKEDELETLIQQNKVLDDIKNAQGFDFNQFVNKGKGSGRRGGKGTKPEDEVAKALKDELSLIKEMQSNYDKLRKAGVDTTTALEIASSGYGETLNRINAILTKFGISMFNASDFVGKDADPNVLLKKLQERRATLLKSGKVKLSSLKDLDVEIQRLNVDVKVYNMKKVTDGLNNELSKIKDEYELMVSIDAMPELGNIFTDLFNIDTSQMPKNIEDVIARYQQAIDKALADSLYGGADMDVNDMLAPFDLLSGDLEKWAKVTGVETGSGLYKGLEQAQKQIRDLVQKDKENTIKQYEDLRYKLADNAGKIAIEQEKLERLQQKLANETNEERRRLLELQIQDQENAIAKLKETILSELPTYKALFDGIVEHSSRMTRRLAQNYKKMLDDARKKGKNSDGKYVITDPINGEETEVSEEKLNKEIEKANNKLRETQSSFAKIKEALTKGEDGLIDWAKGVELIAGEAQKAANIIKEVAGIAEGLGASEDTVEIINDIAESIDGMATAAQGATQIANGDIIGGTLNVVKGLWQSVSSWFDNSNKRIDRKVKESERTVARLEIAYKRLQYAVEDAYGAAKYGAMQSVLANKKLQLEQLKTQLQLERSRKSKNQDEDKILDLQSRIQDLEREIQTGLRDITNDMLGISSIGDAAETLVMSMIEAFKKGEDYMGKYSESFEEMIDNMIMKAIVGKVIGDKMQQFFDFVDNIAQGRADKEGMLSRVTDYQKQIAQYQGYIDNINNDKKQIDKTLGEGTADSMINAYLKKIEELNKKIEQEQVEYTKAATPTPDDIAEARGMYEGWKDEVKELFNAYMGAFGIEFGQGSDKNLSALQQGIQGITEDTAGTLEAYMNGVSQQVYLHSALLTEIRDAVVMMSGDMQLATQAQMLLQLQQSYSVQMAIQAILEGWTNANGMAVRVELTN